MVLRNSVNIQLGRFIQMFGDVSAVLLALLDALGEKIFDLSVHRAEIVLRPRSNGIVELCVQAEGNLLLLSHQ